mmetsp:Transcript_5088/g.11056  ORF Transcript_5088/g.11056 Transcript_5088/m.11056 type:complete len:397 (-) Transcript_5088:348-1538(-)
MVLHAAPSGFTREQVALFSSLVNEFYAAVNEDREFLLPSAAAPQQNQTQSGSRCSRTTTCCTTASPSRLQSPAQRAAHTLTSSVPWSSYLLGSAAGYVHRAFSHPGTTSSGISHASSYHSSEWKDCQGSCQADPPPVSRRGTVTCDGDVLEIPGDVLSLVFEQLVQAGDPSGLRDAIKLSMACKRMRSAYSTMLCTRRDLALQAEEKMKALREKRRLVRRLTLTHHESYVKREVAFELSASSGALLLLSAACLAWPHASWVLHALINFAAFTAMHLLIHTAMLAASYRAGALLGCRAALVSGVLAICTYYLLLVPSVQMMLGIQQVPPHLNLEPWGRQPGSPRPFYPAALLIWPVFGTSVQWRFMHAISNTFAWAYGIYEWGCSLRVVKACNNIKY